jgi:hypothetical protein
MSSTEKNPFESLLENCSNILKVFEQLDKIEHKVDNIHQLMRSVISSFEESKKDISEKKNTEHVKSNDKSAAEADGEKSVEIKIESNIDKNEQKKIAQNVVRVFNKFRHNSKSKKSSASTNASLKVSTLVTWKLYVSRLKKDPHRVFRRKKKYKWDDGG